MTRVSSGSAASEGRKTSVWARVCFVVVVVGGGGVARARGLLQIVPRWTPCRGPRGGVSPGAVHRWGRVRVSVHCYSSERDEKHLQRDAAGV